MTLSLEFHGGADEVTGSRHLLRFGKQTFMLDCGLFQGHRRQALEKTTSFPADPKQIDAVLISHAHIDHTGALPLLVKKGFSNPIHCTGPTADLLRIMLMDSAYIQEQDAVFFNKIHKEEGIQIDPLYNTEDVERTLGLVRAHAYGEKFSLSDDVSVEFLNAGHVLGSSMIRTTVKTEKAVKRILFTGDLGRRKSLLMEPPVPPNPVDYLLMESTYGARSHEPVSKAEEMLAEVINRSEKENGPILIPSFALERTQEIVYLLQKLIREKRIKPIHIYVDSPMAVEITEVFNKHLDSVCLSDEFKDYVSQEGDPFGWKTVRYVRTVEESKSIMKKPGRKIIMAGSGMCEGGRILHHLRNLIDNVNTTILIVGYQAEGTLGRRLADGHRKVKIFGVPQEVNADVRVLHSFSAHADQNDLLWFAKNLDPRPQKIFLVHGDADQRERLREALHSQGIDRVECPRFRDKYPL